MDLKAVSFEPVSVRVAAAAAVTGVIVFSSFIFIWGFANAASTNADLKEVADLLLSISPSDPQTHFAAASLHEESLEAGDFETAVREYEIAASLAPHNYLLWLRLAAVRGRAGDTQGAEAALLQARRLAPGYSRVQWAFGNFLLREGRDDEAYLELRKAVEGEPTLAPLAAAMSLQMSDGNAQAVVARFQDFPKINASIAVLLAGQDRFDEAVEIWNRTPPSDDESYRESEKRLREALIRTGRFASAAALTGKATVTASIGKVTNGGFEQPVKTQDADAFDWKVTPGAYPQVGITDIQKVSGNFSLIVLLSGQDQKAFRGPSQLIAIRHGGRYELSFEYRSDVRSAAAFHWEIVSAKDPRRLALSPNLAASQDWSRISVPFVAPEDSDGIVISLVRGECVGTNCNSAGNFWFDDMTLTSR